MTDLPSQNQDMSPTNAPTCPEPVRLACYLLWGAQVVSLLSLIPGVHQGMWDGSGASTTFLASFLAIVFIAMGLLIWQIHRGKNWARWLNAVLVVLGWWSQVTDIADLLAQGVIAVAIELLVSALEGYALFIIFSKRSSPWFAKEI